MKKYCIEATTPLKFYKFLRWLLPISCILSFFSFVFIWMPAWLKTPQYYMIPLFYIDILIHLTLIVLLFVSAYDIPRLEWRGVCAYSLFIVLTVANTSWQRILPNPTSYNILVTIVAALFLYAIILVPYWIYFLKRRPLFTPYTHTPEESSNSPVSEQNTPPTEETAPAEVVAPLEETEKKVEESPIRCASAPVEKVNGTPQITAPSSPVKKRSKLLRYDTYIACPVCSAMIAKGTPLCACGYDFRTPFQKYRKTVLKYVVITLLLVGCSFGSYFLGRMSMSDFLQQEYDRGYTIGYSAGHSKGFGTGYNQGKQEASSSKKSHITLIGPDGKVYTSKK